MMKHTLILAVMPLAGCAAMQEWLAQPGNTEAMGQVGSGAVRVVTNPLDFFAWWEIVAGVTALVAGPPAAIALKRKAGTILKEKVLNPTPEVKAK